MLQHFHLQSLCVGKKSQPLRMNHLLYADAPHKAELRRHRRLVQTAAIHMC